MHDLFEYGSRLMSRTGCRGMSGGMHQQEHHVPGAQMPTPACQPTGMYAEFHSTRHRVYL